MAIFSVMATNLAANTSYSYAKGSYATNIYHFQQCNLNFRIGQFHGWIPIYFTGVVT